MSETVREDKKPELVRVAQGRSPAYPYVPLDRAIERTEKIRDAGAARTAMPPETFYKIWDLGAQSSGARQTMAALNHFGLVDYIGRGDERKVKLSDLAHRIVFDRQPNSPERAAAVREAALTPSIHRELFERYGAFLPADVVLQTYLVRDRGYNEQAAKSLIDEYKDTLQYAGLDKPDNMPGSDSPGASGSPPLHQEAEVGDLIQWESAGTLKLPKPARVRAVQELDGQKWVFIEGSETGIPMEQVLVEQKGPSDGKPPMTPPRLPETHPDARLLPAEREWLRGPLSKETSYRLIVSGELGPKEIGKLIKLLEAQKTILTEDDDEGAE